MSAMPPVVVVANPTSGRGKGGRLIGRVDKVLNEIGVEHEIRVSGSGAELETLAREAGEQGARIVAVLGGDGSIGLAANGVFGTGAALAVLPGGTGNDFAKAIGARRLEQATRSAGRPRHPPDRRRPDRDRHRASLLRERGGRGVRFGG